MGFSKYEVFHVNSHFQKIVFWKYCWVFMKLVLIELEIWVQWVFHQEKQNIEAATDGDYYKCLFLFVQVRLVSVENLIRIKKNMLN